MNIESTEKSMGSSEPLFATVALLLTTKTNEQGKDTIMQKEAKKMEKAEEKKS